MANNIRAIYENGYLRLLEPLELPEGSTVNINILSDKEQAQLVLKDILVHDDTVELDEHLDEETLIREVQQGLRGTRSLSDIIIEERGEQL